MPGATWQPTDSGADLGGTKMVAAAPPLLLPLLGPMPTPALPPWLDGTPGGARPAVRARALTLAAGAAGLLCGAAAATIMGAAAIPPPPPPPPPPLFPPADARSILTKVGRLRFTPLAVPLLLTAGAGLLVRDTAPPLTAPLLVTADRVGAAGAAAMGGCACGCGFGCGCGGGARADASGGATGMGVGAGASVTAAMAGTRTGDGVAAAPSSGEEASGVTPGARAGGGRRAIRAAGPCGSRGGEGLAAAALPGVDAREPGVGIGACRCHRSRMPMRNIGGSHASSIASSDGAGASSMEVEGRKGGAGAAAAPATTRCGVGALAGCSGSGAGSGRGGNMPAGSEGGGRTHGDGVLTLESARMAPQHDEPGVRRAAGDSAAVAGAPAPRSGAAGMGHDRRMGGTGGTVAVTAVVVTVAASPARLVVAPDDVPVVVVLPPRLPSLPSATINAARMRRCSAWRSLHAASSPPAVEVDDGVPSAACQPSLGGAATVSVGGRRAEEDGAVVRVAAARVDGGVYGEGAASMAASCCCRAVASACPDARLTGGAAGACALHA